MPNFLDVGRAVRDILDGLTPILASLFMDVHEKNWVQNYSFQGPL